MKVSLGDRVRLAFPECDVRMFPGSNEYECRFTVSSHKLVQLERDELDRYLASIALPRVDLRKRRRLHWCKRR